METSFIVPVAVSVIGTLLLGIGTYIAGQLGRLTHAVEALNVQLAAMTPRIDGIHYRVERLESNHAAQRSSH